MKLFWIGLACFTIGAIFGMWLLVVVVQWVLSKVDRES